MRSESGRPRITTRQHRGDTNPRYVPKCILRIVPFSFRLGVESLLASQFARIMSDSFNEESRYVSILYFEYWKIGYVSTYGPCQHARTYVELIGEIRTMLY